MIDIPECDVPEHATHVRHLEEDSSIETLADCTTNHAHKMMRIRDMLERHKNHEGDAYDGLAVEYVDPTSGQPVFRTLTFMVQMLQPGQTTLPTGRSVRRLPTEAIARTRSTPCSISGRRLASWSIRWGRT